MGRRFTDGKPDWQCWWPWVGQGRFWRRQLHKAERQVARGRGRTRSVRGYAREVNWKTW